MLELLLYCIAVFTVLILYYFYKPVETTQSPQSLDDAALILDDDSDSKLTLTNKLISLYQRYCLPMFKYLGLNETNYFNNLNKTKDISLNSSVMCNKIADNYR